ncbi:haloalkane dehalogenase [Streptomyces jumonjinensis]|uniref:Haloalkane dehalogenase n=1 Tax=Streptomyces jumonjinensis TaxID=1945 RepID=A0A646KSU7_STRJU|nr:haloalkane dehalogenase [Streptomyces jumonjinensis]MQT05117.1 haloalkane dehalogenase [Streptomyces jumonjinensis]
MPQVRVLDSTIAYREVGSGVPWVFLHGNPTSSYLWRNVLPAVGDPGRRLAPDLIGMGDSGKPDIVYTFDDHARYLDAWFDALDLDEVVLVGHDWGAPLAFDQAARHPGRVRALAFSEPIVKPLAWAEFPDGARNLFRALRTPGVGETMILQENMLIEKVLPSSVVRGLSDEDLAAYRKPYPTPASRRPMLQWARSMPLDGEPADVVARIEAFDTWLAAASDVPKLLLAFEPGPGTTIDEAMITWCTTHIAALDVTRLGLAGHDAPEDQPAAIAAAIAAWADTHRLRT